MRNINNVSPEFAKFVNDIPEFHGIIDPGDDWMQPVAWPTAGANMAALDAYAAWDSGEYQAARDLILEAQRLVEAIDGDESAA